MNRYHLEWRLPWSSFYGFQMVLASVRCICDYLGWVLLKNMFCNPIINLLELYLAKLFYIRQLGESWEATPNPSN